MAPKKNATQKLQKMAATLQATTSNTMIEEIVALLNSQPAIIGAVLQNIRAGTFSEVQLNSESDVPKIGRLNNF